MKTYQEVEENNPYTASNASNLDKKYFSQLINDAEKGHGHCDLNENDWVYLSDYLDDNHAVQLNILSTSSQGSSWFLLNRMRRFPWVLSLLNLDVELKELVISMVKSGKIFELVCRI